MQFLLQRFATAGQTAAYGLLSREDKRKIDNIPSTEGLAPSDTAVTSITASGTTVTYKNSAGTSLGTFTTQDTNTHYTTKLIIGASTSTVNATAANGSVYLRLFDDTTARNSIKITGAGTTTVTSTADGTLTITGTGTTYSLGTTEAAGIVKLYNALGTNTDGTVTQAAINTALSSKMASNTNVTTVVQTPNTDSAAYPILLKASTATTTATSTTLFASGITVNPATKTITATTFSGNATTATKATQDSSGNVITDTYLTKAAGGTTLSVSGTTLTLQNSAGSNLSSVTTQDTHYTTKLIVGASTSTVNAAASNGSVYFRLFDDATARNSIKITGSGATAVTSASDGTLTIASTNTTYSQATASALGLTKLYTATGTATDGTMTQAAINTALATKMASNTAVTNVTQTIKSDNAGYPVLMTGASSQTTTTTTGATFCTGVKINPSNSSVTATTFIGNVTGNVSGSSGSCTGNAATATQLANPRTIQTSLGSTAAASFNGTANITPGVTGTLGIGNGGTGLTASPSMLTDLGSTTAANVLQASPRPGVTGTLPITNGGTGATTVVNARKALFGDTITTTTGQHFILISDSWTSGGYLPLESTRGLIGTGYAACSIAAGTAAKTAAVAGFALVAGRQVMINFSATNTVAAPTLNVNSTGAKSMCSRSGVVLTYQALGAGLHHFVYDGTYYREVTPPHCTRYTTCSTAAATVAKVVTCDNWVLETGARITVKFTVTNTAANPTLNVNSSGAKPIYYRGYAVVAAALQANCTYDLVYNGTQFEITGSLLWTE